MTGGNGRDLKEQDVRRLLGAGARPAVPPDLLARALAHGARVRRLERVRGTVLWLLITAAVVAFAVWAAVVQPWAAPPMGTTPPLEAW
ncbi:hypothetical protein ACFPM3_28905 [Streptomyces coeruleoprunus]|uniref:Uncharacterized protein n=1 Tax=Streptomyces coeruleoprunus TaxID=285563 RepID=A0ABV9XM55_9ACTN